MELLLRHDDLERMRKFNALDLYIVEKVQSFMWKHKALPTSCRVVGEKMTKDLDRAFQAAVSADGVKGGLV